MSQAAVFQPSLTAARPATATVKPRGAHYLKFDRLEKSLLSHAGTNPAQGGRFTAFSPGSLANRTGPRRQFLRMNFSPQGCFSMACTQHVASIETGSRLALDARADQGMRLITLANDMIRIERVLKGVKMRIHIPAQAYRGVMLQTRERQEGNVYEIRLMHPDPELSVFLEASKDRQKAEDLRQLWADFFARPDLESRLTFAASAEEKPIAPKARRRCMTTVAKRRPRRVMRRKPGNHDNLATIRRGEREIICYE
jgi:hypothetical protein